MENQNYNNNNNKNNNFGNNHNYENNNDNDKQNFNNQFPPNGYNQNQDPFSLDNMFFNKTEFREYLLNMNKDQRKFFISLLPHKFVKSSRMPSLKSKSSLIAFCFISLFTLISLDRLYVGKIFTGIIKLIMPVIVLVFILLFTQLGQYDTGQLNVLGYFSIYATIASLILWKVWIWTDLILAILEKRKDSLGIKVDI